MKQRALRIFLTLFTVTLIAATGHCRRLRTPRATTAATHGAATTATLTLPCNDTVTCGVDTMMRIAGYDKPVNSSKETLHVTNTSTVAIEGMSLDITYLDLQQRQLHNRVVQITAHLEPGETRMLDFPTWDLQRSFYYTRSNAPRRQATPYDIIIKPVWVITQQTVPQTPNPQL